MKEDNFSNTLQQSRSINVLDVVRYLLFHWHWFVLSSLLFVGYYMYQYSKTPFMYRQTQVVMIKTPANSISSTRLTRTNAPLSTVNVAGDILQLRSKELMRQTIQEIDANISYTVRKKLRVHELYTESPVRVDTVDGVSLEQYTFHVIPLDEKYIEVHLKTSHATDTVQKVMLGTPFVYGKGKLIINPTTYYDASWFGIDIQVTKVPVEHLVAYFMNNMRIQQIEDDASLLNIAVDDRSPKRAADLITALIRVHNRLTLDDKSKVANSTADFIRGRLAIIEAELGTVEFDIERLRTANRGIDVAVEGNLHITDQRSYQSERIKIETDLKMLEMMEDYLSSGYNNADLVPNNTGLVETTIESQIQEYNTTLLRRNRLVDGSGLDNPVIQDLDRSLKSMRDNIALAVKNTKRGLQLKLDNSKTLEQKATKEAMRVPEKQRVMLSVERQQKVKEDLYVFLLNKREENALNQAMTEDNIRIIDPSSGSTWPVYPVRIQKLLMGAALGVSVPAIILILMWVLDTKVRVRHDLEQGVTVPLLGEIPLARRRKATISSVMVSQTSREPLTEAFRILRTNISFMSYNQEQPRVFTFTSFTPGVGKTFSVLNLAATLAFLGKKTIVLDLDLRKGTLSERLGLFGKDRVGMTHYLSNQSTQLEEVVNKTDISKNLDVLPIGYLAPNPVELLLSDRLDQLLAQLRTQYDYILVDGVPAGLVADARIINRISELTIFVVRAGRMDRRQLPELEKLYHEKKLTNLSVLLNGVKPVGTGYGYGYGYGYGTYGYGNRKTSMERLLAYFKRL